MSRKKHRKIRGPSQKKLLDHNYECLKVYLKVILGQNATFFVCLYFIRKIDILLDKGKINRQVFKYVKNGNRGIHFFLLQTRRESLIYRYAEIS